MSNIATDELKASAKKRKREVVVDLTETETETKVETKPKRVDFETFRLLSKQEQIAAITKVYDEVSENRLELSQIYYDERIPFETSENPVPTVSELYRMFAERGLDPFMRLERCEKMTRIFYEELPALSAKKPYNFSAGLFFDLNIDRNRPFVKSDK
jgi:hypothetical protein